MSRNKSNESATQRTKKAQSAQKREIEDVDTNEEVTVRYSPQHDNKANEPQKPKDEGKSAKDLHKPEHSKKLRYHHPSTPATIPTPDLKAEARTTRSKTQEFRAEEKMIDKLDKQRQKDRLNAKRENNR